MCVLVHCVYFACVFVYVCVRVRVRACVCTPVCIIYVLQSGLSPLSQCTCSEISF